MPRASISPHRRGYKGETQLRLQPALRIGRKTLAQKPRIEQMASVCARRDTCSFEFCSSRESNVCGVEF